MAKHRSHSVAFKRQVTQGRQQFAAEQVQLLAQQHELAEHWAEGFAVVAAEVGDRLEVWLEMPQQPDHLYIAVGLGFEPAAGTDAGQVAIYIELEQIGRRLARTAGVFRLDTSEPCHREFEPLDEGLDEPNRVLRADVVVRRFRQQQSLGAVMTSDVRHVAILMRLASRRNPLRQDINTVCLTCAQRRSGGEG